MKGLFKNTRFKLIVGIVCFILVGAILSAAVGHTESVQSTVVGTVVAPLHFVAQKISNGLDSAFGKLKGDAAYEKKIASLESELSDMKAKVADYESLRTQNELYKDFLELKENNPDYKFEEASVIARDSADIYKSFSISKGTVNGIAEGDAVLYKKNLVGVVYKAYPNYSVVRTILDPSFNVSAYEIISNEISYVTGNSKLAADGKCKMANLSSSTQVAYGSIICTAGVGGTVPKGLVIGTVDGVYEETSDISSYASITPDFEISEITSCFVLTDFKK